MRDWSLKQGDPLYLNLAADARLCKTDYANDHIWQADMQNTVGLATTFGLRARAMQIFLRFQEGANVASAPRDFSSPPVLRRYAPNFLTLEYAPFESLRVTSEFWIPESHAAAGRLMLANQSNVARRIRLEVCAALTPLDGQALIATQQQLVNILAGQTGGIAPVIFLTGGPSHGAGSPVSLTLNLELAPGGARQITFAEAALNSVEESFELARRVAARNWEAERARIEMLDASQILDIRTGDPEWDAALMFSQQAAHGFFLSPTEHLPQPSFVSTRHPENGFSPKGDGADYSPAWSGQTPLESYYLASALHAAPQATKALLLNFLSAQNEDGEIDHKVGLGAQRSKLLAAPLLASLAWRYVQFTDDDAFSAEAYPKLTRFFWSWFSPAHDRNRDGIPEWTHPLQTGFEDNPIFDVWNPGAQGLNISLAHHPALEAMLYREAVCLVKLAERLNKPQEETLLIQSQAEKLRASLASAWNAEKSFYAYRDYETGAVSKGKLIAKKKGDGNMRPKFEFETPARLLIEVLTKNPSAARPEVEVSEYFSRTKGETETISAHQFQWRAGGLVATTQKTYARVGRVSVRGLDEKDRIQVKVIDTSGEDLTLATPLWAGVPEAQQANALMGRNLTTADRFDRPFGLPALAESPDEESSLISSSVYPIWNQLAGEGMLRYGFRAEATRLTARLVSATLQNLKQHHTFYQRIDAESGAGMGERGALQGIAPVGLFMQALGVRILSANRVQLAGGNLFPWTVTIKYKGLTVVRSSEQTVILFPNGETSIVKDEAPCEART